MLISLFHCGSKSPGDTELVSRAPNWVFCPFITLDVKLKKIVHRELHILIPLCQNDLSHWAWPLHLAGIRMAIHLFKKHVLNEWPLDECEHIYHIHICKNCFQVLFWSYFCTNSRRCTSFFTVKRELPWLSPLSSPVLVNCKDLPKGWQGLEVSPHCDLTWTWTQCHLICILLGILTACQACATCWEYRNK